MTGSSPRRFKLPLVPLLLLVLALIDLEIDIRLLFDHFTLTTLFAAIQNHPLAITILVLLPSLWKLYQRQTS